MWDISNTPAKRLLIVTGPQGSGNHVFSRIFSQHPEVQGWESLRHQYWVPSDQESFAEFWVNPQRLTADHFAHNQYFLANVSVPFFYDGVRHMPRINEVAARAVEFGVEVVIAIVTRDHNINTVQQQRVGQDVTLWRAMDYYQQHVLGHFECHIVSHECFFLWRQHYIKYLGQILRFPVLAETSNEFIESAPNGKYVHSIDHHWLDDEIRNGRQTFQQRGLV